MNSILSFVLLIGIGTIGFAQADGSGKGGPDRGGDGDRETTIDHGDGSRTEVRTTREGHVVTNIDENGNRTSGGSAGPGNHPGKDHQAEVEQHMGDGSKVSKTNDPDLKPGWSIEAVQNLNNITRCYEKISELKAETKSTEVEKKRLEAERKRIEEERKAEERRRMTEMRDLRRESGGSRRD